MQNDAHDLAMPEGLHRGEDGRTVIEEVEIVRRQGGPRGVGVVVVLVGVVARVAILLPGALGTLDSPDVVRGHLTIGGVPDHADVVANAEQMSLGES